MRKREGLQLGGAGENMVEKWEGLQLVRVGGAGEKREGLQLARVGWGW